MTTARRKLPLWVQNWWIWFAAILLVTFASFWPTFFSAIVNVDAAIIVHGTSATGWMLLTVVQAFLIKSRRRKTHHLIGYGSLLLAAILVSSGVQMLRQMIQRDGANAIGEHLLSFKFFYLDITGLVLFCLFLALSIMAARKRDIALHLRLITCTAIIPLEAALERTFIFGTPQLVPNWTTALFASNVTLIALTFALVLAERRYGRVRWPFAALLSYYILLLATTDVVAGLTGFQEIAFAFAGSPN